MIRSHNFGAGPCVLPQEVLNEAAEAVKYWAPSRLSILETSHRHPAFESVVAETEELVRELLDVPEDYAVLFLQGGASTQFGMVPLNFLPQGQTAAYLDTGYFSRKAIADAARYGTTEIVASSANRGYRYIPTDYVIPSDAKYFHFCSNNTVEGTQQQTMPFSPVPLVCDMSSDIFSRQINISDFGLIYAGAQKNMGPAGMTMVIVSKAFLEQAAKSSIPVPSMLDYRLHAEHHSVYNTAPVFSIFTAMLNLRWLKAMGGVTGAAARNAEKAAMLYRALDTNDLFLPYADKACRSFMNVTFHLPNESLTDEFLIHLEKHHIAGVKGLYVLGGLRASMYNALEKNSVEALCAAINEFAHVHRYDYA